jgi:hypothetical protein
LDAEKRHVDDHRRRRPPWMQNAGMTNEKAVSMQQQFLRGIGFARAMMAG